MSVRGDRAQTGIDFLVGATVFLIAVGFVFAFVPSMFAPFGGSGVNDALIADRSAAYLAEYALVEDSANPGVLSTACTAVFFDTDEKLDHTNIDSEHECNFDPDEIKNDNDLTMFFSLQNQDWKSVNVTIGEPDTVDWNEKTIEMQLGDDRSSTGSETVSQRVVSIDGEPHELRVRVWS